jgi:hypothetical protein
MSAPFTFDLVIGSIIGVLMLEDVTILIIGWLGLGAFFGASGIN